MKMNLGMCISQLIKVLVGEHLEQKNENLTELFEFYETLPTNFWWIKCRNDLIGKFINKISRNKEKLRVLDLGCGTGLNYDSIKGNDCLLYTSPSPRDRG